MIRHWPLLAGLALFLLLFPFSFQDEFFDPSNRQRMEDQVSETVYAGEVLLHGLPTANPMVPNYMPMDPLVQSLLYDHTPLRLYPWVALLIRAAPAALAFQLGSLLCGSPLGGLAALLFFLPLPVTRFEVSEARTFVPLMLLVANLTALRARKPGVWRSAALGLAIGMSLLCRSPLFLFPIVIGAYAFLAERHRPARARLKELILVLTLPYLFLVPRTISNQRLYHRFIPLEDHRAEGNVVTGALGLVPRADGDYLTLAGIAPGTNVYRWAAGQILHHPYRYAGGVLGRLGWAFRLHPLLLSLGLLAAWLGRRRRDQREVGLLACYFLAVYSTMSVAPAYFDPLWPIFAGMIPGLAAGIFERTEAPPAPTLAWLYLIPAAAVAALSLPLSVRLPGGASRGDESFKAALAGHPEDAWLWYLRGERRLQGGEPKEAVKDLSRAESLKPNLSKFRFDAAWARAAAGGATEPSVERIRGPERNAERSFLLKLLWDLQHARFEEAARAYADARRAQDVHPALLCRHDTAAERRSESALAGIEKDKLPGQVIQLLAPWPPADRLLLLERLEKIMKSPALLAEEARQAVDAGRREAALRALRLAAPLAADGALRRRLAGLYESLGERTRALALLDSEPGNADSWLEFANSAAGARDKDAALAALRRAEAASPDAGRRRRIAAAYAALGQDRPAIGLLSSSVQERPADADAWLDLAELKARSRDPKGSLAALRSAGALALSAAQKERLASDLTESGDYGAAIALLESAGKERPQTPSAWLNLAALARASGDAKAFSAALRGAEGALGSGSADDWLSLANLKARAGDKRAALAALRRAEPLARDAGRKERLASAYAALGEYRRPAELLEAISRERPQRPAAWLALAGLARAANDVAAAVSALRRAEALRPTAAQKRSIADSYAALGRDPSAISALESLVNDEPGNADAWLELARLESRAGDGKAALAALGRAEELAQDEPRRQEIAALYVSLGANSRALAILDGLLEDPPAAPEARAQLLNDRGVLRAMMGRPEEAMNDLRAAIDAAPGKLSSYVTLGGLYVSAGRGGDALALYDAALARPVSPADSSLKALIQADREKLRGLKR